MINIMNQYETSMAEERVSMNDWKHFQTQIIDSQATFLHFRTQ